jgi:hypothetical protein
VGHCEAVFTARCSNVVVLWAQGVHTAARRSLVPLLAASPQDTPVECAPNQLALGLSGPPSLQSVVPLLLSPLTPAHRVAGGMSGWSPGSRG